MEPNARVLVYESSNPTTAQFLNAGDTFGSSAKEDGGFDVLLTPGDRAEVYIQARDKAGNRGAMKRVRDVAWTIAKGGVTNLDDTKSPHRLRVSRTWDAYLDQPLSPPTVSAGHVTTSGTSQWRSGDVPPSVRPPCDSRPQHGL